jgi:hypothetical protein
MNLNQVKQDLANGMVISKGTWEKVLEAALMLEVVAADIGCDEALEAVEAL